MACKKSCLALALTCVLGAQFARALPPEDEMRRLVLATEKAVAEQRWDDASRYLMHMQALKVEPSTEAEFLRGQVMYHAGQYDEARNALDAYVTDAGQEGSHYKDALQLITDIDEAQQKAAATPAAQQPAQEPVASIKPARDNEIQKLEKLYLKDNPRDALMAHANSLLALNAWHGDDRIIHADQKQGLQYHLSSGKPGELLVQKTRYEDGQPKVTLSSLSVYGVNPLVKSDCLANQYSCWVYDPRDGSRWLHIGRDAEAADNLAHTLSELIRVMQKP